MNISLHIEKLITYAKIHLLLDEADEIYVRNALMQELGLTSYEVYDVDEEEIEEMANPYPIVNNLFACALEKGLYKEEERMLFAAKVMDIVSMRPGEIEDTISSLKNPTKALEWAFDYAVKNGSAITDFTRWENKGVNLEVVFTDGCAHKSGRCCKCVESEGYGVHRNGRFILLPTLGEWYYKAARHALFYGMGHIISAEHKPLVIDEEALNVMFDFVEYAPGMYIFTGESKETANHAHFVCGNALLPIHKAGDKAKYKNKEYPYINITETDWFSSAVKLSCTNREKLIEFSMKLISSFKSSFEGGKIFVSVRRGESKFIVDLAFMAGEPQKEHAALSTLDVCAMAGVFKINSATQARLKEIEKYLTKEVRFSPMCLTGGMEDHAKMIDTLLKEVGNSKLGSVEAALDVKEETKKNLAALLSDVAAYKEGIKEFVENL